MTRVAVVTGGTRGIGAEVSKGLHEAGYMVIANYHRNVDGAQRFAEETSLGIEKWDVSKFAECEAGLKRIVDQCGPVDILVNNAGITRGVVLHRMPEEAWHDVVETNLTSCFNMCRLVIPAMRERGFGRIVNIGSINGQAGQVGQTNYAAAKAGICMFHACFLFPDTAPARYPARRAGARVGISAESPSMSLRPRPPSSESEQSLGR